jgi:hypothetical protein
LGAGEYGVLKLEIGQVCQDIGVEIDIGAYLTGNASAQGRQKRREVETKNPLPPWTRDRPSISSIQGGKESKKWSRPDLPVDSGSMFEPCRKASRPTTVELKEPNE